MKSWLTTEFVAVAAARELRGKPLARRAFDETLALARDSQGHAFALREACPHRGAPLSRGAIKDGRIECPYHGLSFDRAGRADSVPWSEEACALRARSFAVLEQDGLLFASASSNAAPPPALRAPAGWRHLSLQLSIAAPYGEVVENFMDSTHTGLVHPGLIRSTARRRARRVTVTSEDRTVTAQHAPLDEDLGIARRWLGPGLIAHRDTCHLPGTVEVEYAVDGQRFFRALVFVTPRDERASEVFVRAAFSSIRSGRRVPDLARSLGDRLAAVAATLIGRRVLRQDREILEATEASVARVGSRPRAYQPSEAMHGFVHDLLRGQARPGTAEITLVL